MPASSIEQLPLEVIHQILSLLTARELTHLRSVCRTFSYLATSCPRWRFHLLDDLVTEYAALSEIGEIPLERWSFSLAHDGWFRAYSEIQRVMRAPWLLGDKDLMGSDWFLYFKDHLQSDSRIGLEEYHSLIRFRDDLIACAVEGLPLQSRKWRVEGGVMKVSAYPNSRPGRDPRTLCRKLEHVTVAMLSHAPEFLEALTSLNAEILDSIANSRLMSRDDAEARKKGLEDAQRELTNRTKCCQRDKMRRLLGLDDPARKECAPTISVQNLNDTLLPTPPPASSTDASAAATTTLPTTYSS